MELDDLLDGKATHHREVMSHESESFKALFPKGIKYLEGGAPSGFRSVCDIDLSVFVTRLLQIRRVGKQTVLLLPVRNCFSRSLRGHCKSAPLGMLHLSCVDCPSGHM